MGRKLQWLRHATWRLREAATSDPYKRAELYRLLGARIGPETKVYRGAALGTEPYLVSIGSGCRITAGVGIITHGGAHVLRREPGFEKADTFGPVVLGDNVYVGVRSLIMPGVTIGNDAVIGAGSVVTKDIPAGVVAAGVPCRPIGTTESLRNRLRSQAVMTKGMGRMEKKAYLTEWYGLSDGAGDSDHQKVE